MTENPGAILVEWQNVEEQLNDIQEFRLQRVFGNVLTDKHLTANFVDCYTGPETQHLVKDVRVNQQYSFRVCCKFEGAATWSPWSLTQVAMSTIEPFHWRLTEGFLLTNEQKIATPNDDSQQLLLVSDGAQFRVGFSIEFTVSEVFFNEMSCNTHRIKHFSTLRHFNFICFQTLAVFCILCWYSYMASGGAYV